jgi:hypothetical protein
VNRCDSFNTVTERRLKSDLDRLRKEEELTAHTGTSHDAIAKSLVSFRFSGQVEELWVGKVVDFCIAEGELGLLVCYLEAHLSNLSINPSDGCRRLYSRLSFRFRCTYAGVERRKAGVSRDMGNITRWRTTLILKMG